MFRLNNNVVDSRTYNLRTNSILMIFIQILSMAISFLLVPMTISYVDSNVYGIWLTLSSVVGWISVLNIGLNNSLRNRFAEARAQSDNFLAKKYVSTTYALLSIIFGSFLLVFIIANIYIPWCLIFNLPDELEHQIKYAMAIIVAYFCMRFIFSSINMILLADQRSAESSFRTLLEQIASIIVIFILTKTTEGSLVYLSVALCGIQLLVLILFNITLFCNRYKEVRPSPKYVDFSISKDLFSVGLKFFIINIAGIIQFQMTNFLILRYFGGDQVTSYNIAYKYFNIPFLFFSMMLTPLWSAVTEAYIKHEYKWISRTVKRYVLLGVLFCLGIVIMLFMSDFVYHLWLRDNYVNIPFKLSLVLAVFNMVTIIGGIFVNVLNGLGKLNIQMLICILSPVLFLLLTYLLVTYTDMGIAGIVIASILANFNAWLVAPIHVIKIFKNNAE